MMKKIYAARALTILAAFAFAAMFEQGQAQSETDQPPAKPIRILTTIYPLHIMVLNLIHNAQGVYAENMTPPTAGCLHNYNLTPNDLKAIANAQILIVNGAGMENFLEHAFKLVPRDRVIVATAGIDLIRENNEPNPHVWVGPSGAIEQVRVIAQGLARLDPARAETYRKNADVYIAKLEGLRSRMQAELAGFKGRPIVTFHEAFPYFAKEFGLSVIAVVSQNHGAAPNPRDLISTMEAIRKAGATVIFTEPQYPSDAARALAEETGAKIFSLDPAATGPVSENAYIEIMENNLHVLRNAMQ